MWNHPSRKEQWFGGGRDEPGIHSILVDPRDARRMLVAISTAGVFETKDAGHNWTPRNKGLDASFLPDPSVEVGHDVHAIQWCAKKPDVVWQQNRASSVPTGEHVGMGDLFGSLRAPGDNILAIKTTFWFSPK